MEGEELNKYIQQKLQIIEAGDVAVEELLKVAKKPLTEFGVDLEGDEELSADRLTRAAQAKKMCIMDAFEISNKCEQEKNLIEASLNPEQTVPKNFTSDRAKSNK